MILYLGITYSCNPLQISSAQNSRKMLRLCTDKVLMNMRDIRSLRDVIERLRSVARTNGLVLDDETVCEHFV